MDAQEKRQESADPSVLQMQRCSRHGNRRTCLNYAMVEGTKDRGTEMEGESGAEEREGRRNGGRGKAGGTNP